MEGTRKRAVVYTGTFRETYTDWFVIKSDIYLISQAILLMTEEWFDCNDKRIEIEEELKRVRYSICPVCNGHLVSTAHGHDCMKCSREWRRHGGVWVGHYSATKDTFNDQEMKQYQQHRIIKTYRL